MHSRPHKYASLPPPTPYTKWNDVKVKVMKWHWNKMRSQQPALCERFLENILFAIYTSDRIAWVFRAECAIKMLHLKFLRSFLSYGARITCLCAAKICIQQSRLYINACEKKKNIGFKRTLPMALARWRAAAIIAILFTWRIICISQLNLHLNEVGFKLILIL